MIETLAETRAEVPKGFDVVVAELPIDAFLDVSDDFRDVFAIAAPRLGEVEGAWPQFELGGVTKEVRLNNVELRNEINELVPASRIFGSAAEFAGVGGADQDG